MSVMSIGMPVVPSLPTTPVDPTASAGAAAGAAGVSGPSFGSMLADSIDNLQAVQANADGMAVQAASGDLQDVHDYTIAAEKASLATELAVTMRNKAVEAFTEIMRMPL